MKHLLVVIVTTTQSIQLAEWLIFLKFIFWVDSYDWSHCLLAVRRWLFQLRHGVLRLGGTQVDALRQDVDDRCMRWPAERRDQRISVELVWENCRKRPAIRQQEMRPSNCTGLNSHFHYYYTATPTFRHQIGASSTLLPWAVDSIALTQYAISLSSLLITQCTVEDY